VYSINDIDCVCLNGRTTSNGVENWFYNIKDFIIESNELVVPEFMPNPVYKLKNSCFKGTNWGYSVDIDNELQYKTN